MYSWQGTGEAGVRQPIDKHQYYELVSTDVLRTMVEFSCQHFGCDEPSIIITKGKTYRGKYWFQTQELVISQPITGLLLHELAHHIQCRLYGIEKCNGRNIIHDDRFYSIVQELHDLWRR